MKFGFIGCGNMGGALASAVAKSIEANEIAVCDAFAEKAEAFAKAHGVTATDTASIAQNAEYIFLGVKPQVFEALFAEISPILKKRTGIAPEDIGALVLWGQGESWTLLVSAKKPFNDCKYMHIFNLCNNNVFHLFNKV